MATRKVIRSFSLILLTLFLSVLVAAQSTDITVPTPIRTNEVLGAILPRDLGDARLTDHFYIFTGVPGDLLLTVEGRNLNGDVDVFTASGLRPLLKFSLYAGSNSPVTKSIFLRRREDLVLRVEARTPNDDEGNYRLRFGGAFEPIPAGLLVENETPRDEPSPGITTTTGRRVSSVGARIEEPPAPEVAAAPTPEPTPEETEAKPAESPSPAETEVVTTPPRTPRGRRMPGRRTRTPTRPPAEEPPATAETETKAPEEEATASEPAPRRGRGRRGGTGRRTAEPTTTDQEPEVESGPRLVIETNDGTLIDRSMSSVRRVTVENGQVVVIGKDGRIQRIALANVVKMSITP